MRSYASGFGYVCCSGGASAGFSRRNERPVSGIGTEYTTGDYGGTSSVDEIYVPMTGSWDNGLIGLRLSVPWATVRAPEGTLIDGQMGSPWSATGRSEPRADSVT